ncbi:hypothetical protein BC629DRAFT_1481067, partial [Irpex lacteus]
MSTPLSPTSFKAYAFITMPYTWTLLSSSRAPSIGKLEIYESSKASLSSPPPTPSCVGSSLTRRETFTSTLTPIAPLPIPPTPYHTPSTISTTIWDGETAMHGDNRSMETVLTRTQAPRGLSLLKKRAEKVLSLNWRAFPLAPFPLSKVPPLSHLPRHLPIAT